MSSPPSDAFFDKERPFSTLGLDRRLFKAVAKMGLIYPTRVQTAVLPLALQGRDLAVTARTGSGKTLAYSLPLLQHIISAKERQGARGGRALVLVPTKELCDQVRGQIEPLLHYCAELVSVCAITTKAPADSLQTADIIIGTPAKLLALSQKGTLPASVLASVRWVVLDEADLLLSYGYQDDVSALVGACGSTGSDGSQRTPPQTLLLSATLNAEVDALSKLVLHAPEVVALGEAADASSSAAEARLMHRYIECADSDKFLLAYTFLKLKLIHGKIVFFVNSVERCFRLKLFLEQFTINSGVLNAELPLNSRLHILQQFNRGVFDILIATDAAADVDPDDSQATDGAGADEEAEPQPAKKKRSKAKAAAADDEKDEAEEFGVARGVDFQNVKFVVNFDFPPTVRSYVHRAGRTARGGLSGTALSLASPSETELLHAVMAHYCGPSASSDTVDLSTSALQPLPFRVEEVEGFRYRVEDVFRSVTQVAVREARLKDLRAEMLHSQKLRAHFEDNPKELQLLKHDKVLRPSKVQRHLQHVPDYLLPGSLRGSLSEQDRGRLQATERTSGATRGLSKRAQKAVRRGNKAAREAGPQPSAQADGAGAGSEDGRAGSKRGGAGGSGGGRWVAGKKRKSVDPLKSFKYDTAKRTKATRPVATQLPK